MKKTLRGFFFGVIISLLFIGSIPVFAQGITKTIKVVLNGTTVNINGKAAAVENIVYNNKTYVQIDTISKLLGKDYSYETKTKIANIKDKPVKTAPTTPPLPAAAPTPEAASPTSPPASAKPVAFAGYFKNPDYSNPDIFKIPGEQTKADVTIQNIAAGFNDKKDISTIQEIYKWIQANLGPGEGEKFSRTAVDIINSKLATGCTDNGLAFAALSRTKGIPTVFVQTARMDWVKKLVENDPKKNSITGHILVEVLLSDNKWYLVDPTAGKLFYNYDKSNLSLSDGYYVFAKSIEVFDSGVKNVMQNNTKMLSVFEGFDISKYKDPLYEYMNLSSGSIQKSQEYKGMTDTTPQGQTNAIPQGKYVILGGKESTLAFRSKLLDGTGAWAGSENLVKQDQLNNATVIDLHVKGTNYPSYLTEYFPDINSTNGNCAVFRYTGNGQKRILVIADSEADFVNWIKYISTDFLNQ
jgi:hypothetical protein